MEEESEKVSDNGVAWGGGEVQALDRFRDISLNRKLSH